LKKLLLIGGVAVVALAAILAVVEYTGQSGRDPAPPGVALAPAAAPAAPSPSPAVAVPPQAAAAPRASAPPATPVPAAPPASVFEPVPGSVFAPAPGSTAAPSPRILGGGFDEPPRTAPAPAVAAPVPAARQDDGPPAPASAAPQASPKPQASAQPQAPAQPSPAPPAGPATPPALSFDAIRVNADGGVTIAGRGPAGARILLMDGDRQIGSVQADSSGGWIFLSDAPIPAGDHQISLRLADGGSASGEVATVVVPERGQDIAGRPAAGGSSALVMVTPQQGQGASTVLQAPAASARGPTPAAPGGTGGSLSIDVIDYGEGGAVIVSGRGRAGATVRLYLNNRRIGEGGADLRGLFRIQAEGTIAPGVYRLRADQLDAAGKVTARAETPFQRAAPAEIAVADGRVVVQPGNSLWRIARKVYGEGVRYTVIYQANQEQIRDPDLIYPGQIFAVPAAASATVPG
jgi:hypothetical protein